MITVSHDFDLAPMTTFGIGARARDFVEYESVEELLSILGDSALPRPMLHIGSGSNLLFVSDFAGTVLHCRNRTIELIAQADGLTMTVRGAAGVVMDDLCRFTAEQGLWGLENLSGIPGEVGAAPVQNVGAYGVEAADVIESVEAIDTLTRSIVNFKPSDMHFAYRDSMFKHPENKGRYIVTFVTFALSRIPRPKIGYAGLRDAVNPEGATPMDIRDAVIALRDSKLPNPSVIGSAGSFFKNPVVSAETYRRISLENVEVEVPAYKLEDGCYKIPAAWLIDCCGWKGRNVGGASVWTKQPLVIVNTEGTATAADVVNLEKAIIDSVEKRFGITLHPEVEHIKS